MNKFVLISLVLAAISGVGVLSHNIFSVDLQPFQVFNSFSDFTDPVCTCAGDDGLYSMENCEGFTGDYRDPNMLCESVAGLGGYGEPAVPILDQGCGVGFWKNNLATVGLGTIESVSPTIWPDGYQPNYYFNDMFHTTISQPQKALVANGDEKTSEDTDNKNKDGDNEEQQTAKINDGDDKDSNVFPNDVTTVESDDELVDEASEEDKDQKDKNKKEDDVSPNDIISSQLENEQSDNDKKESDDNDGKIKSDATDIQEHPTNMVQDKGPTLLEALEANGGDMNRLLRHSVAALLNAAHTEINYPYTVPQVISMTQVALINQDWQRTADLFERYNENAEKPALCLG